MEFESLTKDVFEECRRLTRNKKLENEVREAFETIPDLEEIPVTLQRKIDEQIFFSDGPEVTMPADKFTFDY